MIDCGTVVIAYGTVVASCKILFHVISISQISIFNIKICIKYTYMIIVGWG